MAPSRAFMLAARHLWLLVPLLGIGELAAHRYFAERAPDLAEWRALRAQVAAFRKPGDLVVPAPDWTSPLARHAFGDELLPIADLARPSATGYRSALEVSVLGQRSRELSGWREIERREAGDFTLRRLENPEYRPIKYRFVDHVRPPDLLVAEVGDERVECRYTDRAAVSTGGLHGAVAFPRERYRCSGGPSYFVGVTIIDDQGYRPRRCIFAHPVSSGSLDLAFRGVPLGTKLRGYAGLSYFLARDGLGTPVTIVARAGGEELGRYEHHDEWGFREFAFDTSRLDGTVQDVTFSIESAFSSQRDFCFYAETL